MQRVLKMFEQLLVLLSPMVKIPGETPALTNTPTGVVARREGIRYMPFLCSTPSTHKKSRLLSESEEYSRSEENDGVLEDLSLLDDAYENGNLTYSSDSEDVSRVNEGVSSLRELNLEFSERAERVLIVILSLPIKSNPNL